MGWLDFLINYDKLSASVAQHIIIETNKVVGTARGYRLGRQPSQLRVGDGQFDDNLRSNYIGLIADRIVSQTIGKGIKVDFEGDTETPQEQFIDACLDANHEEILFHNSLLGAGEAGTGYWYLLPDGAFDEMGQEYPRIENVDPAFCRIETLPDDIDTVLRYYIEYKKTGVNGKDIYFHRVIEQDEPAGPWFTRDYEGEGERGKWTLTQEIEFPYPFCPMLHWKNLPSIDSVYGQPHITRNLIELQDRYNFTSSNISKIIRYHAHPKNFSRMMGSATVVHLGPDDMPNFNDPAGGIFQLEQLSDLSGPMAFLASVKKAMFDTSRVVDIDTMQDKIGALTNFGLRVLYQDNLAMIATKRELFGDAIETAIQRLQIMGGFEPIHAEVRWPDMLPVNEIEQQTAITGDLSAGIVSLDTARQKRGYDADQERERMAADLTSPQLWAGAKAAVDAGVSLEGYLRTMGVDQTVIQTLLYEGIPTQ